MIVGIFAFIFIVIICCQTEFSIKNIYSYSTLSVARIFHFLSGCCVNKTGFQGFLGLQPVPYVSSIRSMSEVCSCSSLQVPLAADHHSSQPWPRS